MKTKIFIAAILIFSFNSATAQSWFATSQNADLMISGVDFNNAGSALSFNHPSGLATDGTRLLVCDRFNNRVLVWNTAPSVWNSLPDLVLGQTNFTSNNPGTSKSELNWPGNASLASNGVLAITDTENDRILIWLSFPISNGQVADISLHLPTILPPPTPKKWPWGVWTDGTRLAVVATTAHTLLFWNTMPTVDNQPPDYTINLPQFGTPRNISTDGSTYFFVGDHNALGSPVPPTGSPGTFFWNSYPSSANQLYNFFRKEWIKGTKLPGGQLVAGGTFRIFTWNTMPTDSTQLPDQTAQPSYYKNGDGPDVVYANNRIFVNNYNGNNVLVYDSIPTTTNPDASFAIGVSDYHNNTLDSIGYIQNGVPASNGKRLIVTSDFDRKIYIYNSLPASSGVLPDTVISLNMSPWDNALFNNKFVIAGKSQVAVWNNASQLASPPSQTFTNNIGTAVFSDLKGVALDNQFFYLADGSGKIFIWSGIPANSSVNPLYTISLSNAQLNRISSDGTYFCVAKPGPPSEVYIYKVADIAAGNLTPWKILSGVPGSLLNLASHAIAFNGSLAIANTGNNNVVLWKDINDAGDLNAVIILGQPNLQSHTPAIGQNRLFMPGALLAVSNNLWVSEFKFSSRILKFGYLTSGIEINGNVPESYKLYQNYPNPFNPTTTIKFQVSDFRFVSLKIFDVLGREVATLVNGEVNFGEHSVIFDARDLSSGVYFYRLTTPTFSQTKSMAVLK